MSDANALTPRPGRFQIEPLEERIAPTASLIDINAALNVSLTGPMKNVHLKMDNIYVVISDNVIQAGTGGILIGSIG